MGELFNALTDWLNNLLNNATPEQKHFLSVLGLALAIFIGRSIREFSDRVSRRDPPATSGERLAKASPPMASESAKVGPRQQPFPVTRRSDDSTRVLLWVQASLKEHAVTIVCIVALILAVLVDWPYAYYVLLRFGVCAVSLYWAVEALKRSQVCWVWALGANAVLFNPVLPVRMQRSDWEIVNLLDATFLAAWMV